MINGEMIVLEIVEKYPETEDIFRSYDETIGKCILCYFLFDSLSKISIDNNLNLDELINKLNSSIK